MAAVASAAVRAEEVEMYTELACEVYHELEHFVADPKFLKALERPPSRPAKAASSMFAFLRGKQRLEPLAQLPAVQLSASPEGGAGTTTTTDVDVVLTSSAPADRLASTTDDAADVGGVGASTSGDEFVLLDRRDAVEAFAFYLSAIVMDMPEAQALPPKQLQEALLQTLRSLRKSRLQKFCSVGHNVYRWSALAYSTFQFYNNPWLAQIVLSALWTFSRMSIRAFI